MNKLLTEILQRHEFHHVVQESQVSNNFGDAIDVFANKEMKIRIISDRGTNYIEIANMSSGNIVWEDIFNLAIKMVPCYVVKTGSFGEAIRLLDLLQQDEAHQDDPSGCP